MAGKKKTNPSRIPAALSAEEAEQILEKAARDMAIRVRAAFHVSPVGSHAGHKNRGLANVGLGKFLCRPFKTNFGDIREEIGRTSAISSPSGNVCPLKERRRALPAFRAGERRRGGLFRHAGTVGADFRRGQNAGHSPQGERYLRGDGRRTDFHSGHCLGAGDGIRPVSGRFRSAGASAACGNGGGMTFWRGAALFIRTIKAEAVLPGAAGEPVHTRQYLPGLSPGQSSGG